MRTVEFKLDLSQSQQTNVDEWLQVLRWVWNRGLHLLEEFDSFTSWDKVSKAWVPSCPIRWEYYRDDDGQLIPFTRLAQTKPYRMSCLIPQVYRQPELASPNHFGLLYYFAQKNHKDKPWFCEVPSKVVAGTLKALADAWSEYKAGKRKRPRYKRYKDKLNTLVNNNSKSIKISGKQIILPNLGKVTVKTLDKRWDTSVPIATLKIIKEPSGYYLQLTGELPSKKFKSSNKAVGISLGHRDLFTTDGGKVVKPPAYYHRMEKRLVRLQRKLSRQQNLCPISTYNPKLGEHFNSCPINPHKGANKAKTQQQISRLHERIRRARRAFNHKLSTKLVQEYGGIALAKSELQKITRRPKPIVNKSGTGYNPNGAERKSLFNQLILANGLGQLTTLIEQKAVVNGREFIEIVPKSIPDEPRQRVEHHSKKLRLPRAVYLSAFHIGRYRAWSWKSKPGESQGTLNQEAAQVATLREAETTFKSISQPAPSDKPVDASDATSSLSTFNQQQPNLLPSGVSKSTGATSQGLSETESQITASLQDKGANQQKKAQRRKAASPATKNQAQRKKRRHTGENDSS
jgi:putative transposase